jgi:hypothetical protein
MSATLDRTRVPPEYTGRARVFRDRVREADEVMDRVLASIAAPLNARLKRHPRLRHELIAAAVKLYYGLVPAVYRLGTVEVTPSRDDFAVREVRVTATWMHSPMWAGADPIEPGVALCNFAFAMRGRKMTETWTPIALISLHALSRWFERTRCVEHGMLLRDLTTLIGAGVDGDRVPTPDGCWRGSVGPMFDVHGVRTGARSVRTWAPD